MNIVDLVPSLPTHPTKKAPRRSLSSINQLVVHTTDWETTPLEVTKYDLGPNHISSTGCPTCTYHYFIDRAGTINRTVPPELVTWHAGNFNNKSLAVCLAYKTDPEFESGKKSAPDPKRVPTPEMMSSLILLLVDLCKTYNIPPTGIQGHRELEGTGWIWVKEHKQLRKTCPGMMVNLDSLRARVAIALQNEMSSAGLYKGAIDGVWGPLSEKAFQALLKTLN